MILSICDGDDDVVVDENARGLVWGLATQAEWSFIHE